MYSVLPTHTLLLTNTHVKQILKHLGNILISPGLIQANICILS